MSRRQIQIKKTINLFYPVGVKIRLQRTRKEIWGPQRIDAEIIQLASDWTRGINTEIVDARTRGSGQARSLITAAFKQPVAITRKKSILILKSSY